MPNAGDPHLPTCSFFRGDGQEAGGNGKPYAYSTILTISESGNTGENGNYSQVSFPSIQKPAPRIRQRFGGSSPRLTNWRDFLGQGPQYLSRHKWFYKNSVSGC
ncbi:hypothetical protein S887_001574 [Salmonella enterica subsp. diarizonae]|nr:hypothetical protein [Salmonella enterica subsp. diarizonae]